MDKTLEELIKLCQKHDISVRIHSHNGEITLYNLIGDFEHSQEAFQWIKNNLENEEEACL